MEAPVALDVIYQKDAGDCSLAAVAMFTGRTYGAVSRAAIKRFGESAKLHREGLYTWQITWLLNHLNCRVKRWPAKSINGLDLSSATGLIDLQRRNRTRHGHVAVLFQGVLVNPADGMIWDLDTFLTRHPERSRHWRVVGFWGEAA